MFTDALGLGAAAGGLGLGASLGGYLFNNVYPSEAVSQASEVVQEAIQNEPGVLPTVFDAVSDAYREGASIIHNINPIEAGRAAYEGYSKGKIGEGFYNAADLFYNPIQTLEELEASRRKKGELSALDLDAIRREKEFLQHSSNVDKERLAQEKLLTRFGEYAVGNPRLYGEYFVGKGNIAPQTKHAAREQAGIPKDDGYAYFGSYTHQPLYGTNSDYISPLSRKPYKGKNKRKGGYDDDDDDNHKPGRYGGKNIVSRKVLSEKERELNERLREGEITRKEFEIKMKKIDLSQRQRDERIKRREYRGLEEKEKQEAARKALLLTKAHNFAGEYKNTRIKEDPAKIKEYIEALEEEESLYPDRVNVPLHIRKLKETLKEQKEAKKKTKATKQRGAGVGIPK